MNSIGLNLFLIKEQKRRTQIFIDCQSKEIGFLDLIHCFMLTLSSDISNESEILLTEDETTQLSFDESLNLLLSVENCFQHTYFLKPNITFITCSDNN